MVPVNFFMSRKSGSTQRFMNKNRRETYSTYLITLWVNLMSSEGGT
jgi:hypothetical protein